MPTLVCGPIVGHVSSKTANILLEFDGHLNNLEIAIHDITANTVSHNNDLSFLELRPRTHVITGLEPEHKYRIDIVDHRVKGTISANFQTHLEDLESPCIIGISGWSEEIADRLYGATTVADVLVHCGNLVPLRHLIAELVNREVTPTADVVEAEIRTLYRRSLTRPKLRAILASCSNLAIWGVEESLTWPGAEQSVAKIPYAWKIAHTVYREYIRSLVDNDDSEYTEFKPREYYAVRIGKTSLVFIDTHGEHLTSFSLNRNLPMLGNSQRRLIKEAEKLDAVNIVFVSDEPFVSISKADAATSPVTSIVKEWPSKECDMKEIFGFAHERAEQKPEGSVMLLAGGDECSFTSIIEHDNCSMYQIVTGRLDHKMVSLNIPSILRYKSWTITHHEVTEPTWAKVRFSRHNGRIRAISTLDGAETSIQRAKPIEIPAMPIHENRTQDTFIIGVESTDAGSHAGLLVDANPATPAMVTAPVSKPVLLNTNPASDEEIEHDFRQLMDEVSTFRPGNNGPIATTGTGSVGTETATDGSSPVSAIEKYVTGLATAAQKLTITDPVHRAPRTGPKHILVTRQPRGASPTPKLVLA